MSRSTRSRPQAEEALFEENDGEDLFTESILRRSHNPHPETNWGFGGSEPSDRMEDGRSEASASQPSRRHMSRLSDDPDSISSRRQTTATADADRASITSATSSLLRVRFPESESEQSRRLQQQEQDLHHLHTINRQRLDEIIRLKKALQSKGMSASQRASTVSGLDGKDTAEEQDDISKRLVEYGREVAVLRNTNRNVCEVLRKLHGTLKGCREGLRKLRDTAQSTKETIQRHVDAAFDSFAYDLRVMFVVHRIGSRTEKENLGTRVLILESEVDVLGHRLEKSQKEVERLKERDAEQIQTIDWMQGKIDTLKMQLKEYEARFLNQEVANDKMKTEIGTLRSSIANAVPTESSTTVDPLLTTGLEKPSQSPTLNASVRSSNDRASDSELETRLPKPPTPKPQPTSSSTAANPAQPRASRPQLAPRTKRPVTQTSKIPTPLPPQQDAPPSNNSVTPTVPNTSVPTPFTSSFAANPASRDQEASASTQHTAAAAVQDLLQQVELFRITFPTKAGTLANALYQQLDRLGYGTSAPVKPLPSPHDPRRTSVGSKPAEPRGSLGAADPTPESERGVGSRESSPPQSRRGTSGKIAALIDTMTESLTERSTAQLSDAGELNEVEPLRVEKKRQVPGPWPPVQAQDPVAEVVARILSLHDKWLMKWSARREELIRAEEFHYLGLLELSERSARSETVSTHINLDAAEWSGLHTTPASATKNRPSTGRTTHKTASQPPAPSNWALLGQEARYYSAFCHKYKYHWASVPTLQFDVVAPARLPMWYQSPRGDVDPELPTFRQIIK